jgi:thiamine biosynthesis protein ThiC
MQIQILACNGTAANLQDRVTEVMRQMGNDHRKTVQADAYGADGLVDILEVRATNGQREILVLSCSRLQIQAVLDWQSSTEDNNEFEDLELHLVRNPDSDM